MKGTPKKDTCKNIYRIFITYKSTSNRTTVELLDPLDTTPTMRSPQTSRAKRRLALV
jgi:hypothetical protein